MTVPDPAAAERRETQAINPLVHRAAHFWWWLTRGMTLGVRGLVVDADRRVFLVRHGYVAGWHLPGGGVEVGETARDALARELMEEGKIRLTGEPELAGFFHAPGTSRRDHVVLFHVRHFSVDGPRAPDREITGAGFFPIDALPDGTTRATRERLAEWDGRRPISLTW